MEYLLVAILIVAVVAVIAYPLFTSPGAKNERAGDALDNWIAQRDSAYDAIRDLDFDYQMGKLSQSDYDALRNKYRARAASALEQIDRALGRDGAETGIEEKVTRLRARRGAAPARETPVASPGTNGDAIEEEVARLRAGRARCPRCGTPYPAGDRFCAKCGGSLQG